MTLMRLGPPPQRRSRAEPIIPMINVVFLLLIFFLLSASLAPPEAVEVTPPQADANAPADPLTPLLISADGRLGYAGAMGEAVWPAIAAREGAMPLPVRADAALSAAVLARVLGRLAQISDAPIALIVTPRAAP